MLNSYDLRYKSREDLKANYGISIAVCLIIDLILASSGSTILIYIILAGPLYLGQAYFFLKMARHEPVKFENLFYGFNNFVNSLVLNILKFVFVLLWTLLFIVPGIIKWYSYSMSFYILSDNPNMDGSIALKESERMMTGYKWELFKLDFSFIGWILLSVLTFGIGFIFLIPYMQMAHAEFYLNLKYDLNIG